MIIVLTILSKIVDIAIPNLPEQYPLVRMASVTLPEQC